MPPGATTNRFDEPVVAAGFVPEGSMVGLLRNKEKGCEPAFEMWGPRALLQAARERVTRNLTPKEWEQHIGN